MCVKDRVEERIRTGGGVKDRVEERIRTGKGVSKTGLRRG